MRLPAATAFLCLLPILGVRAGESPTPPSGRSAVAATSASPDLAFPPFLKAYLRAYAKDPLEASRWMHPMIEYRTVENPGVACLLLPARPTVGLEGERSPIPSGQSMKIQQGLPPAPKGCDDESSPYPGLDGVYWEVVSAPPAFERYDEEGELVHVVPATPDGAKPIATRVLVVHEGEGVALLHFLWYDGAWHPWVDQFCRACGA
ncbi:MAG: hypothetical protein H6686_10825 [Fibrobacteria bacterium]|nr:hypothetical protein [Fibrobacteria bacterium]